MSKAPQKKYTFEQKWGDDPFTALGYAQIPTALLQYGARLGIEPSEGYLICHVLRYKRSPGDEGPDQSDLAAAFGRSVDVVHTLLRRMEQKKFVKITYTRDEEGKFTRALYDFRQLRAYLNECYYQDHPQDRPQGKKPLILPKLVKPVPQIRGAAKRSREVAATRSADSRDGTPRSRGLACRDFADSLIESLDFEEEKTQDSPASLFGPEQKEPEPEDMRAARRQAARDGQYGPKRDLEGIKALAREIGAARLAQKGGGE